LRKQLTLEQLAGTFLLHAMLTGFAILLAIITAVAQASGLSFCQARQPPIPPLGQTSNALSASVVSPPGPLRLAGGVSSSGKPIPSGAMTTQVPTTSSVKLEQDFIKFSTGMERRMAEMESKMEARMAEMVALLKQQQQQPVPAPAQPQDGEEHIVIPPSAMNVFYT